MSYLTTTAVCNNCQSSCCKGCEESHCFKHSYIDLEKILNLIDQEINNQLTHDITSKRYGWGCVEDGLVKKLTTLREPIEEYMNSIRHGYSSICDSQINNIISLVKHLLTKEYSVIEKNLDYSNIGNSNCIPYEMWEKAMHISLPQFSISATLKECVRFSYDIKVTVPKDKYCDVLYAVKVSHDSCELTASTISTLKECDIEYRADADFKNCTITVNSNVYALEDLCNLGEIIANI